MGRIAYTADFGARILPMNYVFVDDCVILRTVPDGEIYRHALNSNCAFEIDKTHEFFESGWSIVVLGDLNWQPKTTSRGCNIARCLRPGLAATDTCSFDFPASMCRGGE